MNDPFAPGDGTPPPARIWAFYWHYLRQVRGVLAAICFIGFFVALVEASLFDYVGRLVDLATQSASPRAFFDDHGDMLPWMAVAVVLIRPVLLGLHDLLVNQALVPGLTARIRWQQQLVVMD